MKTCDEWSLEFDLLYNNITSNKAPGLTPYEKAVFLTRAQETVVVALYKGTLGDAFESTEEVSVYLAPLIKQKTTKYSAPDGSGSGSSDPYPDNAVIVDKDKSYVFANELDMLFRTLEFCHINTSDCGEVMAEVIPVTQDEYLRTIRNPFKKQNGRRVLRLVHADSAVAGGQLIVQPYTELISDNPVVDYTVRYISRPLPIILNDAIPAGSGLSINGYTQNGMTCRLDEALHQSILAEAVRMAKAMWIA